MKEKNCVSMQNFRAVVKILKCCKNDTASAIIPLVLISTRSLGLCDNSGIFNAYVPRHSEISLSIAYL